jgi:pimeloyl-ACP methyl ester carboxylesterase
MPNSTFAAQDSQGRDFWITFLKNYTTTPTLQLFITSDFNTQGTVEIPGISWSQSYAVEANRTTTVNIPSIAMLDATGVQKKGIHITANDEVTAYGLNQIRYTTDAFLSLPVDASGFEYFVMAYMQPSSYLGSEFAVVANHDNTTFNYRLPNQGNQTVSLNQGEVYFLNYGADVTGTYIESDKPVSVFGGAQCTNIPPGYGACDHIVEQIPALSTWGKKFYTVPLATRTSGDTFRIMAGKEPTEVKINGTLVATLEAGRFHEQIIRGVSIIETSQPALVAQYSNGSLYDGVTSDPFMMIVPPIEQALNHYTFSTPGTNFSINYVNVLIPNSILNNITLDGGIVNSSLFTSIPGTNFSGAQIRVSVGSHTISAPQNFGIHSYGFASYDSYGYPGGMAFEIINPGDISLSPAAIDLGTFDIDNITNVYEERKVTLENNSNVNVNIEEISIVGQDYSDFKLVSINGTSVNGTTYDFPFNLWPYASIEINIALSPTHTPTDATFDASLSVLGRDDNNYSVQSVTSIKANLNNSTLVVDVLDASPTISRFRDDGVPFDKDGNRVTEDVIATIDKDGKQKRVGVVADGNARVFLRAKTNATSGFVTFNIKQPAKSEALLYDLNIQSNHDDEGFYTLQVPITKVDNNTGQATAIFRAAERYIGGDSAEVNIDLETCYQATDTGNCLASQPVRIREQRAPVVLMHGIWADTGSWRNDTWWEDEGMEPSLEANHFRVRSYNYPGFNDPNNDQQKFLRFGPSTTMVSSNSDLSNFIRGSDGLCDQLIKDNKIACTRSDIVAHSMGGLAARKFINDNEFYKNDKNFHNGAVRRLVTIGTPHFGSQLANVLRYDNSSINQCITDEDIKTSEIENKNIKDGIRNLRLVDRYIDSAIDDLRVDSQLLKNLNQNKRYVPIFALFGDAGVEFNLGTGTGFITKNIGEAGCTHAEVFGQDIHSDGVVPVNSSSAENKIETNNTQRLNGIIHVGMGTNQTVVDTVIPLLTRKLSDFANGI